MATESTSTGSQRTLQRWTTLDEHPVRRLDYYADALEKAVTPMRVLVPDGANFNAHFVSTDLGPLQILRMSGTAHCVECGSREIERRTKHSYHLLANLISATRLSHRGQASLRVGDAFLVDSGMPFQLDLPDYNVLHVRMSEQWVRRWIPAPRAIAGRPILRDAGWSQALCAFLSQLSPEFLTQAPLPLSVISDQIGALLALAANKMSGSAAPAPAGRGERDLKQSICECITERCADSSITADEVAKALSISTRTLHRNLAAYNQTFGALLMSARVELANRMLRSPLFKRLTTAEIGRRAGFVNASHFARVVHRSCGLNPAEIRKNAAQNLGFNVVDVDSGDLTRVVESQ